MRQFCPICLKISQALLSAAFRDFICLKSVRFDRLFRHEVRTGPAHSLAHSLTVTDEYLLPHCIGADDNDALRPKHKATLASLTTKIGNLVDRNKGMNNPLNPIGKLICHRTLSPIKGRSPIVAGVSLGLKRCQVPLPIHYASFRLLTRSKVYPYTKIPQPAT